MEVEPQTDDRRREWSVQSRNERWSRNSEVMKSVNRLYSRTNLQHLSSRLFPKRCRTDSGKERITTEMQRGRRTIERTTRWEVNKNERNGLKRGQTRMAGRGCGTLPAESSLHATDAFQSHYEREQHTYTHIHTETMLCEERGTKREREKPEKWR